MEEKHECSGDCGNCETAWSEDLERKVAIPVVDSDPYDWEKDRIFPKKSQYPPSPIEPANLDAMEKQIGGNHYKNYPIQPTEFIMKNKLSFLQGCIVKRICRYKEKGGREDLEKIKHEVDMIIALEGM